ncbi:MAG: lysozyme [Hyphomicrobiales bacterium]|nr:lysozyme [Hyphomicrobiales bacterium]
MTGPMSMSADCRRQITERSEGLRLVAYRDCVGVLTIGYGHTSRAGAPVVKAGMKIDEAEADAILSRDLLAFERGVAALLARAKAPAQQHEFDALVDLAFNVGLGSLKSSSLLRAFISGDRVRAAQKFLDWNRAGGREIAGLTARRNRDRAWFLTGRLAPEPVRFEAESIADDCAHRVDHPDSIPVRTGNLLLNERTNAMKGYRTLVVGLALAIAPAALQYLGAVDWSALIGPRGAFFVSGLVAVAMRAITTTPVGKSS